MRNFNCADETLGTPVLNVLQPHVATRVRPPFSMQLQAEAGNYNRPHAG